MLASSTANQGNASSQQTDHRPSPHSILPPSTSSSPTTVLSSSEHEQQSPLCLKADASPFSTMSNNIPQQEKDEETVNLLDLAAAALTGTVGAARKIKDLALTQNARVKDDGSLVTDADLASQGLLVQSLRHVAPSSVRIVGEESEEDMALARGDNNLLSAENDAFDEPLFQKAQHELVIRYDGVSPVGDPLPLSCTTEGIAVAESDASVDGPPTNPLQNPIVDPSRVSVFIDPLDGTKAYAKGDYDTVSILVAIILDGIPCFGVICKPFGYHKHPTILDTGCVCVYGGTLLDGAYMAGSPHKLRPTNDSSNQLPRAVISGSRAKGVVSEFCHHLSEKGMLHSEPLLVTGAGEKSLRIVLRTNDEGLWFFPKPGTSLWDVAASDALLRCLGGKLTDKYGRDMDYSKSRSDAENENGIIVCHDAIFHKECVRLFNEGEWETEG